MQTIEEDKVEPLKHDVFRSLKSQKFFCRMIVSDMILERAYNFYSIDLFELSAAAYTLSLSVLSALQPLNEKEEQLFEEHKYIVLCNLVVCLIQQKVYRRAGQMIEGLIRLFPNKAKPYKLRAMLILIGRDKTLQELACQDLGKAILLDPSESHIGLEMLFKYKPQKIIFKSKTKVIQQKSWRLIRKVFQGRDNSEHRHNSNMYYREDSFQRPMSCENKFKNQFNKMKEKTKKLWGKISKSIDNEPDYTYEQDEKISVPQEINKIGEYLDKKGQQILEFMQKTKRFKEAQKLQGMLEKARRLKKKLEKISKLDFTKPKQKFQQIAQQLGLDLMNPIVQQEMKRMHKEKLKKLKIWINKVFGGDIALKSSQDDCLYFNNQGPNSDIMQIQPEQVQSQEIPISRQLDTKNQVITYDFIQTKKYTGQTKVYVYDKSYGLAGLLGILLTIVVLGVLKRTNYI